MRGRASCDTSRIGTYLGALMSNGSDAGDPSYPPVNFAVPDITTQDVDAVARVLRSGWLTTGDECNALESELAEYLGVPHVVAVSSCTAALEIAVAHLELPAGARVGVPTWTFVASAMAPYHHGAHLVLLDIDPDTFNLSPDALERALTQGLDAVVGVHFGGVPLDRRIHELCGAAGIPLIEDAAHALGARDHRGMVAGQGTAGACLSFYATKNLTSGEGGALATDNDQLADFARSYRLHGMSRDAWARYRPDASSGYDIVTPGIKANLPDMLAALARSQLSRFDELQRRRRELALHYRSLLARIDDVAVVPADFAENGADHLMMVLLPEAADRAVVQKHLSAAGITTGIHFRPLHEFGWFVENGIEVGAGGVPVADEFADRALSLPFHTCLSDADVVRVCDVLAEALTS